MPFRFPIPFRKSRPVVPVLRLSGLIAAPSQGLRRSSGLSMAGMAGLIDKAFSTKRAKAVALIVNSPGGSPVQSSLIYGRIRHLSRQKNIPVIAFVEDVAASGGYWLACAGDEILVNPASILGSIGVVSAGFGFDEAIARIGISRRVHTSGERKAMLDPFRPENPDDVAHLEALQADIHGRFIEMVKQRRGTKLSGDESEIFSGAFWCGEKAIAMGLADGFGELREVLEDRFGKNVRIKVLERPRPFFGLAGQGIAASASTALLDTLAERSARARFGL